MTQLGKLRKVLGHLSQYKVSLSYEHMDSAKMFLGVQKIKVKAIPFQENKLYHSQNRAKELKHHDT